jgi:hypothetical protein
MQDYGKTMISTQEEWKREKRKYPSAQDHRAFSERNEFFPGAKLMWTGMPIREALPRARPDNPTGRYKIFEATESGGSVETANRKARQVSPHATKDGDVFIGLHTGYWQIG